MKLTPRRITIAILPLAALGLVAGCASGHPSSAPSAHAAATHSASAAPVHYKYTTNASLMAALKAHGVKCPVTNAGVFTDCGQMTVIRVYSKGSPSLQAETDTLVSQNGGAASVSGITGPNWLVITSPTLAYWVQRAVGGSVTAGHASVSPQQAAQARAAAKAAKQAAAAKRARQQAARRLAGMVTYVVTGTPGAQVTYGPEGSDYSGSVPMNVSAHIPNNPPLYYAIDAQLQGGGQVSCQILVGGHVISSANASGGFNIASCEIGQNPITGQWENDNNG